LILFFENKTTDFGFPNTPSCNTEAVRSCFADWHTAVSTNRCTIYRR